jgi:apolipoprotein N-acyltransferase
MQLVPFGEYVPAQPVLGRLGVAKLVQEVGAFTPGEEARLGRVGGRRLGVTICYEAIFPHLVRRFTVGGADLLVNVTNDGWYGTTSAPYQHFGMARMRAVENGRSLVRAANTGISALIDPRGRVIAGSRLMERRIVVGEVPLASETTPYVRWGDSFAWLCVAATLALSAAGLVRLRRRRAAAKAG